MATLSELMISKILLAIFTVSACFFKAITKHYDFISDILFCLTCCVSLNYKQPATITKIASIIVVIASFSGLANIRNLLIENNNSIITLLFAFSGILLLGLMVYLVVKVCKSNSDK